MAVGGALRRHAGVLLFEGGILVGAAMMIAKSDWFHLSTCVIALMLCLIPLLLEIYLRVKIPALLQVVYAAFIFSSLFLGEVTGLYGRIWWWDDMMHSLSGFLIGGGVSLVLMEVYGTRVASWVQALSLFCSVATVIVLWEVIEFSSDQLFGTHSQGGDLFDTMTDLIYGLVGGSVMAYAFFRHLSRGSFNFFTHLQQLRANHK